MVIAEIACANMGGRSKPMQMHIWKKNEIDAVI